MNRFIEDYNDLSLQMNLYFIVLNNSLLEKLGPQKIINRHDVVLIITFPISNVHV